MKSYTDEDALQLGRSILERFEKGLNGDKWKGRDVVIPFQLPTLRAFHLSYPRMDPWMSDVKMSIPRFCVHHGPGEYEWIDLNQYLKIKKQIG